MLRVCYCWDVLYVLYVLYILYGFVFRVVFAADVAVFGN